jgi:transcription antitermination factor NusG
MTYQTNCTLPEEILEQIAEEGMDAIPEMIRFLVNEAMLWRIDAKLAAIAKAGGQSFFAIQPGETVEISHGVFSGYEGIFEERIKCDERVRVLLLKTLSDRYVPVEVNAGWVTKREKKR